MKEHNDPLTIYTTSVQLGQTASYKPLKMVLRFRFNRDTLFGGTKFKWKLKKLNYTRFEKPDLKYSWKKKVNLEQLFNSKHHFRYKCSLPKSIVKIWEWNYRQFFISGPIGVHYLAVKMFKWKLNKLSNTRFRTKRTSYFLSDKISFRVNDRSIPKFWTWYEFWPENAPECKLLFAMVNASVRFLKLLFNRKIF